MTLMSQIDDLFEHVNNLCHRGDWTSINFIVRKTKVKETNTEMLLAILTAVHCVKSKLLDHNDFVRQVEAELQKRHPDSWKSMLHGLNEKS